MGVAVEDPGLGGAGEGLTGDLELVDVGHGVARAAVDHVVALAFVVPGQAEQVVGVFRAHVCPLPVENVEDVARGRLPLWGQHPGIVIAEDPLGVEFSQSADHRVAVGVVPHGVAEEENAIEPLFRGVRHHGLEGGEVAVDIGEQEGPHDVRISEQAEPSANNSNTSKSAISEQSANSCSVSSTLSVVTKKAVSSLIILSFLKDGF